MWQFIYPNEIFPTETCAVAVGLGVSVSRIGAVIGTYLVPVSVQTIEIGHTLQVAALITFVGLAVSWLLAPETRGALLCKAASLKLCAAPRSGDASGALRKANWSVHKSSPCDPCVTGRRSCRMGETVMQSRFTLDMHAAAAILKRATQHACARGWVVSIAVVDESGRLLTFARLDGASMLAGELALGKARTAAMGRRESKVFEPWSKTIA